MNDDGITLMVAPLNAAAIQPNGKPLGRRFQPGQSGNPGGKPAVVRHIRDLARQHTPEAIEALVRNLTCGNPHAEIAAASELLNRGYGRPAQKVDVDISDNLSPEVRLLMDNICAALAEQRPDSELIALPAKNR